MGPPADTGLHYSPSNFSISWPLRLAICLVLATGSGKALFPPLGLRVWPTAKPRTIFDELNEKPGGEFISQNPGYLGPNSCAPCHAKRVDDFMAHAISCVAQRGLELAQKTPQGRSLVPQFQSKLKSWQK